MKNLIPKFTEKSDLFAFLRENKSKLIAQKKALPTISDDLEFGYTKTATVKTFGTKAKDNAEPVEGELPVDIIANMSGYCDSQQDVMLRDSWKKSITEVGPSGQKIVYHLKNHDYSMDAIVGKNPVFTSRDIDLSMFNIATDIKKAQALICSSTVMQKYDEKLYNLYEDGQVLNHSIGLQYINIVLCLDSTEEEDVQEKKNWDKYYPQVINKDKVDNYGFFWAVIEAKILEVSAVLYGSNPITNVLNSGQPSKEDTNIEPPTGTPKTEETPTIQKTVIGCPKCNYLFVPKEGTQSCPNCGQFVSPNSNTIMLHDATDFDWKKAIQETHFI